MKTLVIFPLQGELEFFLAYLRKNGLTVSQSQPGRLPVFHTPEMSLSLAKGGTGKAQFALQTQHLLDAGGSWDLVICAGAGGALADEVSIGDVVVATFTIEHDYTNRFSERPLPSFPGDPQALDALRQVRPVGAGYRVHFGPVASGDEDIMDDERRQQLRRQTGALAAAWEGAGGARACAFSNVPFLEIRGMTDGADADAAVAFEDNLEITMAHIASLIMAWLKPIPF